jgi:hypothetical protein
MIDIGVYKPASSHKLDLIRQRESWAFILKSNSIPAGNGLPDVTLMHMASITARALENIGRINGEIAKA